MIRAVIFDMDGVLVDSEPFHHRAYNAIFARYGVRIGKEEYSRVWTNGGIPLARAVKQYRIPEDVETVKRRKDRVYLQFVEKEMKLRPGALSFLKRLKKGGFPLALATASRKSSVRKILRRFKLQKYFDVVLCSEDVKRNKPAPDLYLKASERLGIPPGQCLVIEDALKGLLSAKAAGCVCIMVPNRYSRGADFSRADLVVNSFSRITPRLICSC